MFPSTIAPFEPNATPIKTTSGMNARRRNKDATGRKTASGWQHSMHSSGGGGGGGVLRMRRRPLLIMLSAVLCIVGCATKLDGVGAADAAAKPDAAAEPVTTTAEPEASSGCPIPDLRLSRPKKFGTTTTEQPYVTFETTQVYLPEDFTTADFEYDHGSDDDEDDEEGEESSLERDGSHDVARQTRYTDFNPYAWGDGEDSVFVTKKPTVDEDHLYASNHQHAKQERRKLRKQSSGRRRFERPYQQHGHKQSKRDLRAFASFVSHVSPSHSSIAPSASSSGTTRAPAPSQHPPPPTPQPPPSLMHADHHPHNHHHSDEDDDDHDGGEDQDDDVDDMYHHQHITNIYYMQSTGMTSRMQFAAGDELAVRLVPKDQTRSPKRSHRLQPPPPSRGAHDDDQDGDADGADPVRNGSRSDRLRQRRQARGDRGGDAIDEAAESVNDDEASPASPLGGRAEDATLRRTKRKSGKTTGALSRPKGASDSGSKSTSRKKDGAALEEEGLHIVHAVDETESESGEDDELEESEEHEHFGEVTEVRFPGEVGPLGDRRLCKIRCVRGKWVGPLCATNEEDEQGHVNFQPLYKSCHVNRVPPHLLLSYRNISVNVGWDLPHGHSLQARCKDLGLYKLLGETRVLCSNGLWAPRMPSCVPTTLLTNYSDDSPPSIRIKIGIGSGAFEPSGVLAVLPTSTIHLDCMYPRRRGDPEWTWTGWFRPYYTDQLDKLIPGGGARDQINMNWQYHPDVDTHGSSGGAQIEAPGEDRSGVSGGDIGATGSGGDVVVTGELHHHQKFERIDSANKVRFPAEKGLMHSKFTSWSTQHEEKATKYRLTIKDIQIQDSGTYTCASPRGLTNSIVIVVATSTCAAHSEPPPPLSLRLEGTKLGQRALYTCPAGFNLEGTSNSTCLASGNWSSPPPTCNPVQCPPLFLEDPHLSLTELNTSAWGRAVFKCSWGYRLSGPPGLECEPSGVWSGPVPRCRAVQCPQPLVPINGRIDGTSGSASHRRYAVGALVTFSCTEGHLLVGEASIVCTETGFWSHPPPFCKSQCPYPGDPPNGLIAPLKFHYDPGDYLSVQCRPGFVEYGSNGPPERPRCMPDGNWSGPVPQCRNYEEV